MSKFFDTNIDGGEGWFSWAENSCKSPSLDWHAMNRRENNETSTFRVLIFVLTLWSLERVFGRKRAGLAFFVVLVNHSISIEVLELILSYVFNDAFSFWTSFVSNE